MVILGLSSLVVLNIHFDRRKENRPFANDHQNKDFISKQIWENNNETGNGKSREQQLTSIGKLSYNC